MERLAAAGGRKGRGLRTVLLAGPLLGLLAAGSEAQRSRERSRPLPTPPLVLPKEMQRPQPPGPVLPPETIQADMSSRRIAVTSSFAGTEIVVFGTVESSRQPSAESNVYDIVIVVSGAPTRLVARKKARVGGIWLNNDSVDFLSVPTYYSITSTRPLDEIASNELLKIAGIGFDHIPMVLSAGDAERSPAELKEFRDSVIRLKVKEKLYQNDEFSVAFTGRSLFRASVEVPANVTIGSFEMRAFLFRNGELLSRHASRLDLEREGLENALYSFAHRYPLTYGIATVLLALSAGLLASTIFRKGAH